MFPISRRFVYIFKGSSRDRYFWMGEFVQVVGMVLGLHEALMRPGPDLVICDEGHRIKNSHASISQALKNIRTK